MIELTQSGPSQFYCPPEPRAFSAILLPHRSLSRKGFTALMLFVAATCLLSGLAFLHVGAWPVFGFFGLDALLVFLAFRLNYKAARMFEQVDLYERELKVTRVYPSGRTQSWSFNPYWVRLELHEMRNGGGRLSLTSHGRRLVFGAFLSDGEKKDFAAALKKALARQKAV